MQLLAAVAAPDELLKPLQAAAALLSSGWLQFDEQQREELRLHHAVLQLWVARGRVDKGSWGTGPAAGDAGGVRGWLIKHD